MSTEYVIVGQFLLEYAPRAVILLVSTCALVGILTRSLRNNFQL